MPYCVNCGKEIKEEYQFCPECGVTVNSDIHNYFSYISDEYKRCKVCGEKMPEDAFYCLACGVTFDSQENSSENIRQSVINTGNTQKMKVDTSVGVWKNKWAALTLCILFGVFGIHRFYEEKRITGFIYLFTFGLFGFGWFFDTILIATKTNPYRVK